MQAENSATSPASADVRWALSPAAIARWAKRHAWLRRRRSSAAKRRKGRIREQSQDASSVTRVSCVSSRKNRWPSAGAFFRHRRVAARSSLPLGRKGSRSTRWMSFGDGSQVRHAALGHFRAERAGVQRGAGIDHHDLLPAHAVGERYDGEVARFNRLPSLKAP